MDHNTFAALIAMNLAAIAWAVAIMLIASIPPNDGGAI
jgi:hypothetical protein